ncbi:MAG: hypothetical protein M3P98_03470 [bacterium]|nr:hypothetical protein [bacterium]
MAKQKQSGTNKLANLSNSKKLLIFVVIFAVIGGGYLAYRSFAATTGTVAFTNNLELRGNGKKIIERKGSKKKIEVWEIPPGSSVGTTFNTNNSRAYKVCSIFKLPKGGIITLIAGGVATDGGEKITIAPGKDDYQKRCRSGNINGPTINAGIGLENGSDLRVSAVSLE